MFSHERPQRHNGRVGDIYRVKDSKHANGRAGSGPRPILQEGDILIRKRHTGDCFCTYGLKRDNRWAEEWFGYDLPDSWLTGNLVDDVLAGKA